MGEEGTPKLARASWALLRTDRRPLAVAAAGVALTSLVGVATAIATQLSLDPHVTRYGSAYRTAGFGVPGVGGPPSSVTTLRPTLLTAAVLVVGYLLVVVAATFTSAAVVATADRRLGGSDATGIGTSDAPSPLRLVTRRAPQLVRWGLLNGTLGMVHRAIEKRPLLGWVAGRINGLSWRQATWLAVPEVLDTGGSPLATLRRSSDLHRRAWDDDAVARTGLGGVGTVSFLAAAIVAGMTLPLGAPVALAVAFGLAVATGSVVAALAGTGRAALHRHASGRPLVGIETTTVAAAFGSRNQTVAPISLDPDLAPSPTSDADTDTPEPGTIPAVDVAAALAEVDAVLEDAVALLPRRERLRLRPAGYRRPGPRPCDAQPAGVTDAAGSAAASR